MNRESLAEERDATASEAEQPAVIEPVDFKPAVAAQRRRPGGPRPLPILFGTALVALTLVALFMFTAKSVRLEFEPPADDIDMDGLLPVVPIGGRHLAQSGSYEIRAERDGYRPFETRIEIGDEQNQAFRYELVKLPGVLDIRAGDVPGASVAIDGEPRGDPPVEVRLEPGKCICSL